MGRQGRFIAEGEVVLRALVGPSRYAVESVLLAEPRLAAAGPLVAGLAERGCPVYVASQAVMDRVTGFPIHRGVLAVGRRGPEPSARSLLSALPGRALVLAAVGIANHDNMGGLFRNAAAFGVGAVLLDPTCCDPLYRKAIRVSVGGALLVPFARSADASDLLGALTEAGFTIIGLAPDAVERLGAIPSAPRLALLVGAEGPGLPANLLARTRPARIPMAGGFDSLNVATAAGIALHHFATASSDQTMLQTTPSGR